MAERSKRTKIATPSTPKTDKKKASKDKDKPKPLPEPLPEEQRVELGDFDGNWTLPCEPMLGSGLPIPHDVAVTPQASTDYPMETTPPPPPAPTASAMEFARTELESYNFAKQTKPELLGLIHSAVQGWPEDLANEVTALIPSLHRRTLWLLWKRMLTLRTDLDIHNHIAFLIGCMAQREADKEEFLEKRSTILDEVYTSLETLLSRCTAEQKNFQAISSGLGTSINQLTTITSNLGVVADKIDVGIKKSASRPLPPAMEVEWGGSGLSIASDQIQVAVKHQRGCQRVGGVHFLENPTTDRISFSYIDENLSSLYKKFLELVAEYPIPKARYLLTFPITTVEAHWDPSVPRSTGMPALVKKAKVHNVFTTIVPCNLV